MNAGTKIVRSCELVEDIWQQVQQLADSLSAMTESFLGKGEFENLQGAGSSQWRVDAPGWGTRSYAIGFPVMKKKRRKTVPDAWINFQFSVFGPGIPPLERAEQESIGPVLHVSFWHLRTDFDDPGLSVEFPTQWDPGEIRDDRLLYWDSDKDGEFPQWTFSIRLLDLNNEDALRTSIIDPIKALLAGERAADALPSRLPGLVFYSGMNQGESSSDLMAIGYSGQ